MFAHAGGSLISDSSALTAQEARLSHALRLEAEAAKRNANKLGIVLNPPESIGWPSPSPRQRAGVSVLGQEAHKQQQQQQQAASPSKSVILLAAAPPTFEDLYALYSLCGGNPLEVVHLLAKMWGMSREEIRPTVLQWLHDMPPLELPARTLSAPARMLPKALEERLSQAAPPRALEGVRARAGGRLAKKLQAAREVSGPPHADPAVPGAVTAPVTTADLGSVLLAMHAANARVHATLSGTRELSSSSGHEASSHAGRSATPRHMGPEVYVLPHQPSFPPVLSAVEVEAVPDEQPVHSWRGAHHSVHQGADDVEPSEGAHGSMIYAHYGAYHDAALEDFLARTAAAKSELAPIQRGVARSGATRMRR